MQPRGVKGQFARLFTIGIVLEAWRSDEGVTERLGGGPLEVRRQTGSTICLFGTTASL
ncbi:MAG: hypothetical protein M0Z91_07560 [Actinomycetota bacterium]|nr:hypothetical protein [Actinomycetota bacterium]